ncbi:MAG: hypothetical protein IPO13_16150 [Rhodocyclaceae bacterium]|nr:hypothetical protein [Rhodocyclaceae bacterium]
MDDTESRYVAREIRTAAPTNFGHITDVHTHRSQRYLNQKAETPFRFHGMGFQVMLCAG